VSDATSDVFDRVVAQSVLGRPWAVRVAWSAAQQGDRLVQAYVDQQWSAVSLLPTQRELWLTIDASRRRTLELLAVPVELASVSMPWALPSSLAGVAHAMTATVMRDEALPASATLHWSLGEGAGRREAMWPADRHRGGFGGLFAVGALGFDTATGPGLGRGGLGWGPLGADAEAIELVEQDLDAGPHTLSLVVTSDAGVELAHRDVGPVTVRRPPAPPRDLAFDGTTLTWT